MRARSDRYVPTASPVRFARTVCCADPPFSRRWSVTPAEVASLAIVSFPVSVKGVNGRSGYPLEPIRETRHRPREAGPDRLPPPRGWDFPKGSSRLRVSSTLMPSAVSPYRISRPRGREYLETVTADSIRFPFGREVRRSQSGYDRSMTVVPHAGQVYSVSALASAISQSPGSVLSCSQRGQNSTAFGLGVPSGAEVFRAAITQYL